MRDEAHFELSSNVDKTKFLLLVTWQSDFDHLETVITIKHL